MQSFKFKNVYNGSTYWYDSDNDVITWISAEGIPCALVKGYTEAEMQRFIKERMWIVLEEYGAFGWNCNSV